MSSRTIEVGQLVCAAHHAPVCEPCAVLRIVAKNKPRGWNVPIPSRDMEILARWALKAVEAKL